MKMSFNDWAVQIFNFNRRNKMMPKGVQNFVKMRRVLVRWHPFSKLGCKSGVHRLPFFQRNRISLALLSNAK